MMYADLPGWLWKFQVLCVQDPGGREWDTLASAGRRSS
jgi:hypothetical protein